MVLGRGTGDNEGIKSGGGRKWKERLPKRKGNMRNGKERMIVRAVGRKDDFNSSKK